MEDAGLDPICRNAPCPVHSYSENTSGYTDSVIALATFDLMAPSFELGTCRAGLLHIAASEYQPLRGLWEFLAGYVLQYTMLLVYPKLK